MKTPKPKNIRTICDVCGLDWAQHTNKMTTKDAKPSLETCVELLKAEIAKRPAYAQVSGSSLARWTGLPYQNFS